MQSLESAAGHDALDSPLDVGREFEGRQLFLQGGHAAVATAVAVQTTRHVGRDELGIGHLQGLHDISLLTQQVLLMVAGN